MIERKNFPSWLRKPWPKGYDKTVDSILNDLSLNTVCSSAECPNIGECWNAGTATFMVLGRVCTRACRYCAVESGKGTSMELLADEPDRVAEAVERMSLDYVVITSVNRDDLPDGGADHFKQVVEKILQRSPETIIEALVPDFLGDHEDLNLFLSSGVHVLNHNIECVKRIFPKARPKGDYQRSLDLLKKAGNLRKDVVLKSGLMVGFGETEEEVITTLKDLRNSNCDILTIGQYLTPSTQLRRMLPVGEYVEPKQFDKYRKIALEMGFRGVASGPFVRSSYRAAELYRICRAVTVEKQ